MDNKPELIADITLEPGDVHHPFLWSWQNLVRWVLALTACLILYEVPPLWPPGVSPSERRTELFLLYLLVGSVALALFLLPYLRVRSMFRKSPALRRPRRVIFNAEGIRFESEDARGEYKWSLFLRIIESKKVFVLLQTTHAATYIPKRCFRSPSDVELLRQLIRDNFKGKWTLRRD
jgi:YcxB-like protein